MRADIKFVLKRKLNQYFIYARSFPISIPHPHAPVSASSGVLSLPFLVGWL